MLHGAAQPVSHFSSGPIHFQAKAASATSVGATTVKAIKPSFPNPQVTPSIATLSATLRMGETVGVAVDEEVREIRVVGCVQVLDCRRIK